MTVEIGVAAPVLHPRDLMRIHVEALFTLNGRGRLVAVNDGTLTPAPRFFVGVTAEGPQCWFGADLADARIAELEALARSLAPSVDPIDPAPFLERLAGAEPVPRVWSGPAFWCSRRLDKPGDGGVRVTAENAAVLHRYLNDWSPDAAADKPMAVVLHAHAAVSVCCSVRRTTRAHEAGVETHPSFRGQGFAVRAVATWAEAVHATGALPLYSTSWANEASRGVARRLGLDHFGSDLHVT